MDRRRSDGSTGERGVLGRSRELIALDWGVRRRVKEGNNCLCALGLSLQLLWDSRDLAGRTTEGSKARVTGGAWLLASKRPPTSTIQHAQLYFRFALNSKNACLSSQSSFVRFHLPVPAKASARASISAGLGNAEIFGDSEGCSRRTRRVRGAGEVVRVKRERGKEVGMGRVAEGVMGVGRSCLRGSGQMGCR